MSLRALFERYLQVKRASLQGLGTDEFNFNLGPELPEYLHLYNTALKLAQDAEEMKDTELKVAAITRAVELLTRIGKESGQLETVRSKIDFLTKRAASFKKFGKMVPTMSVANNRVALQTLLNNYERQALLFKTGKAKITNRASVRWLMKQALDERKKKTLELLKESNPFMTEEEGQAYLKKTHFVMTEEEKSSFLPSADIFFLRSMETTIEQEIQKMSQIDSDEAENFQIKFDAARRRLF